MPKTALKRFQHKGFITPPVPPLGEFVYFCIPVPNESQHIENFLGAIQTLTLWTNYKRTDDKRGKEIADIWREIWLNLTYSEDDCMSPCCPEELTNQETIIYSNYVQNYNSYISNNQNIAIQNSMLYDGDPQSIFPGAGVNFDSGGDGELCAAIETYINNLVYMHSSRAAIEGAVAAGVASALAVFLASVTFGISIPVGIAISAAIGVSSLAWRSILNDPSAMRDVRCCMYDALVGQPLTLENFQSSVSACGFVGANNNAILAGVINDDNANYDENFTAFLRAMSQSVAGSAANCVCGCDDDIVLEDFEATGTIITHMGNCIYRFSQSTPILEGGVDRYYHSFKDTLDRCLSVQNSDDPAYPTQAQSDHWVTFCNGSTSETVGGITGSLLRQARWREGTSVTYMKITLVEE